jgi:hypothetical protein
MGNRTTDADYRFVTRRDQELARGVGNLEGPQIIVSPDVVEDDQPALPL